MSYQNNIILGNSLLYIADAKVRGKLYNQMLVFCISEGTMIDFRLMFHSKNVYIYFLTALLATYCKFAKCSMQLSEVHVVPPLHDKATM